MKKETKKRVLLSAILAKIAIVAILFSFSSCDEEDDPPTPTPNEPIEIELSEQEENLVTASNSFSFKLFKKLIDSDNDANIVVSPFSISEDLSMLLNGTAGETQQEIIDALELSDLSLSEINNAYKNLTSALLNVDNKINSGIANSLWARIPILESFSNTISEYYDAESFELGEGVQDINEWIKEKTNGLIEDGMEDVDPLSPLYLINAIFFKGKWQSEFNKSNTTNRPFSLFNNGTVDVPMMRQENTFNLYTNEGLAMLELPYGKGNFAMDIILPNNAAKFKEMLSLMNVDNFNEWVQNMRAYNVNVELPKFKYKYGEELSTILSSLGIETAFTPAADLSNMTNANISLDEVWHKAFIETNEEGTAAAAVTIIDTRTSVGPIEPYTFKVNHPFSYVIRETTTNTILFVGKVINPLLEE